MRRRIAIVAALAAVSVAAGAFAGLRHLHRRALSPTCDDLPHTHPTDEDVVSLARRLRAYQEDRSDDAILALTSAELSYLIGDRPELRLLARFRGDEVHARLAVPEGDACYNITFTGSLTVDDGVATVVPEHLVVGDLDMSPLIGGMAFRLGPEDLPDPRLGDLLANTRSLEVRGGRLTLSLRDRSWPH